MIMYTKNLAGRGGLTGLELGVTDVATAHMTVETVTQYKLLRRISPQPSAFGSNAYRKDSSWRAPSQVYCMDLAGSRVGNLSTRQR